VLGVKMNVKIAKFHTVFLENRDSRFLDDECNENLDAFFSLGLGGKGERRPRRLKRKRGSFHPQKS